MDSPDEPVPPAASASLADDLEDWTQEPTPPTPSAPPAPQPSRPALAPQESASAPASRPAPARRPRSSFSVWADGMRPTRTSSLEDWLQGPLEQHSEQEAEDAWSTSDSISGAWRPVQESAPEPSRTVPGGAGTGAHLGADADAGTDTDTRADTGADTRPETDAPDGAAPSAGSTLADTCAGTGAARPDATATVAEPTRETARARPAFRRELHGLRAVALGLVAIYHIWLGRVSGGVDVFLFLSAFFLTGTFVRRLESGRPLGVPRYWLHTFKRLLPPAAVTILLTLAATALFLPASIWPTVMQQSVASVTYLQNALLVSLEVDYHARDASTASPLQHFWSLSVQGQAFVVWPLLFGLVVHRARKGRSVRRPLIALIGLIGAASLTWSIISTASQQEIAYFDTAARLWEFAAGSLLALSLPVLDRLTGARRPEDGAAPRHRTLRALMGWAGIAALLACGIVLDVSSQFPGWIAIWPLTAASAVVVAGYSGRRWGVDRLLSTRPAAFIGDISYALYLVHWPILVIWLHHSGQERAGLLDGLVVLTGSVLLAWMLTRAVDAPVRRSRWLEARPWRSLAAITMSVALVAGAAGGWWTYLQRTPPQPPVAAESAPATDEVATEAPTVLRPAGWQLGSQWPDLPESCGGKWAPATSFRNTHCQQLLPADAEPTETIVVVGSSHSRQYIPALLPLAEERDAQVVNLSMDGCGYLAGTERWPYCRGYDDWVLAYLDAVQPDIVLTTVTLTTADGTAETLPEGTEGAIQQLLDRGIDVIATRDTPRWEVNEYECAEAAVDAGGSPADADAACGADRTEKLAATNPAAPLAELTGTGGASVTVLDYSDLICPDGRCAPVLGDVYVYMDDDHLTRLFVEEVIAPAATRELETALS